MEHIENIIIGELSINPVDLFAENQEDWDKNESHKTYYTKERNLPKILVNLGIYPSISEIRRNKPELMITFDKIDFISIRPKKKIPLWIAIGE